MLLFFLILPPVTRSTGAASITVSAMMTTVVPAANGVHEEPLLLGPAGGVTSPRTAGVGMLPAIKTKTLSVSSPQHESLSQVRGEGRERNEWAGWWEESEEVVE